MDHASAQAIANFLIAEFEQEMHTTARVMSSVPDTNLDYRPDAKSKTGLGLVRHITLEDEWLLTCIANGAFTPPPDDSDKCGIRTPAEAVARYQERLPAALDRIRALSPEQLTGTIDFFGMMQGTALSYLSMTIKHSVHHRGQLSTYLRAMGGHVPGIYGPTADTRAAAATA